MFPPPLRFERYHNRILGGIQRRTERHRRLVVIRSPVTAVTPDAAVVQSRRRNFAHFVLRSHELLVQLLDDVVVVF